MNPKPIFPKNKREQSNLDKAIKDYINEKHRDSDTLLDIPEEVLDIPEEEDDWYPEDYYDGMDDLRKG